MENYQKKIVNAEDIIVDTYEGKVVGKLLALSI